MLACYKSAGPCSVCVSVCVCVCLCMCVGKWNLHFWVEQPSQGWSPYTALCYTYSLCTIYWAVYSSCVVCIVYFQHSVYFSLYTVLGTRTLLSKLLLPLVTPPLLLLLFIKPVHCAVFAFFGTFTTLNVWICILDRNAKTHSIAMIFSVLPSLTIPNPYILSRAKCINLLQSACT